MHLKIIKYTLKNMYLCIKKLKYVVKYAVKYALKKINTLKSIALKIIFFSLKRYLI